MSDSMLSTYNNLYRGFPRHSAYCTAPGHDDIDSKAATTRPASLQGPDCFYNHNSGYVVTIRNIPGSLHTTKCYSPMYLLRLRALHIFQIVWIISLAIWSCGAVVSPFPRLGIRTYERRRRQQFSQQAIEAHSSFGGTMGSMLSFLHMGFVPKDGSGARHSQSDVCCQGGEEGSGLGGEGVINSGDNATSTSFQEFSIDRDRSSIRRVSSASSRRFRFKKIVCLDGTSRASSPSRGGKTDRTGGQTPSNRHGGVEHRDDIDYDAYDADDDDEDDEDGYEYEEVGAGQRHQPARHRAKKVLVRSITAAGAGAGVVAGAGAVQQQGQKLSMTYLQTMTAGAVSRTMAQTLMHPANTYKTLLQLKRPAAAATATSRVTVARKSASLLGKAALTLGPGSLALRFSRWSQQRHGLGQELTLRRLLRGVDAQFLLSLPHGAFHFFVIDQVCVCVSECYVS